MAQVGSLAVRVSANTRPFQQGMKRTTRSTADMRKRLAQVGAAAAKMAAAIAAAGAAMLTHLVNRGREAIDTQTKLARRLGASTASVQGLTRAAELSGIEQQRLERSLEAMNKRLGEAQEGSGRAADTLDKLGLSAQELAEMPLDRRMEVIGEAINGLGTQTERAAAAADLFSRSGIEMMTMFEDGGAAIRQGRQDVEDFGIAVSQVDAAQIEAANDAFSQIGSVIQGVANQIAVKFSPFLKEIGDRIATASRETDGFRDAIDRVVQFSVRGFARLGDLIHLLRIGFKGLQLIAEGFGAAFWAVITDLSRGIAKFLDYINGSVNEAIRGLNKLPGVDIELIGSAQESEFIRRLDSINAIAAENLRETRDELAELAGKPLPSDGIEQWLQEVREASRMAAEETVHAREQLAHVDLTGNGDSGDTEDEADRERERQREIIAARLEAIREGLMTEEELQRAKFERDRERLAEALEHELITRQEHDELMQGLEKDHMQSLRQIRGRGLSDLERLQNASLGKQVQAVAQAGGQMISSAMSVNKGMFKASQVAGAAQSFIATLTGQAEALKLGWPAGPIAAAKIGAQGFGLVAAIKSAAFSANSAGGGGGVGGGGVGGSTAPAPIAPARQEESVRRTEVSISGIDEDSMFSGRQVRRLIERINDEVDGGMVLRTA